MKGELTMFFNWFFKLFGKKKKHEDIERESLEKRAEAVSKIISDLVGGDHMKFIGEIEFVKSIALSGNVFNYLYFKDTVNDTLLKIFNIIEFCDIIRKDNLDAITSVESECSYVSIIILKVRIYEYLIQCATFGEYTKSVSINDVRKHIEDIISSYGEILKK